MRRLEKSLQNIKDELSAHVADMRNMEWESMTEDEYSCESDILHFHEATLQLIDYYENEIQNIGTVTGRNKLYEELCKRLFARMKRWQILQGESLSTRERLLEEAFAARDNIERINIYLMSNLEHILQSFDVEEFEQQLESLIKTSPGVTAETADQLIACWRRARQYGEAELKARELAQNWWKNSTN